MPSIPRQDRADDPFGMLFESVTKLTARLKQALKVQFDDVALQAEVSNAAAAEVGARLFRTQG